HVIGAAAIERSHGRACPALTRSGVSNQQIGGGAMLRLAQRRTPRRRLWAEMIARIGIALPLRAGATKRQILNNHVSEWNDGGLIVDVTAYLHHCYREVRAPEQLRLVIGIGTANGYV